MIERKTQRVFLRLGLPSLRRLFSKFQDGYHLGFSRWPPFKPNFAHNSKTKHDRKANSMAIHRFLGSVNSMKLFSEFQDGGHLGF